MPESSDKKNNVNRYFKRELNIVEVEVEKERLTQKEHWEDRWNRIKLPAVIEPDTRHPISKEIIKIFNSYLPKEALSVLEIGGAPGQFMAYLSRQFGYKAHALDYSQVGCLKMKENFDMLGLDITIYNRDFFSDLDDLPRFDVVFSMGFIEHFSDMDAVVEKHVQLLKENGLLVLGVPNFLGISETVLKHLAPKLLSMHNLNTMDIEQWKSFEKINALEPLFKGYIGGFEPKNFRRCEQRTIGNMAIRLFFKAVRVLVTDNFSFLRKYNSPKWSAYLMGVWRKPQREQSRM